MPRTLIKTYPTRSQTPYLLLRGYPVHPTVLNPHSIEEDRPTAAIPRHHSQAKGVVHAEHGVSPSGVRSVRMLKSLRTSALRALGDWPKRRGPKVKAKKCEVGLLPKTLRDETVGPLTIYPFFILFNSLQVSRLCRLTTWSFQVALGPRTLHA